MLLQLRLPCIRGRHFPNEFNHHCCCHRVSLLLAFKPGDCGAAAVAQHMCNKAYTSCSDLRNQLLGWGPEIFKNGLCLEEGSESCGCSELRHFFFVSSQTPHLKKSAP